MTNEDDNAFNPRDDEFADEVLQSLALSQELAGTARTLAALEAKCHNRGLTLPPPPNPGKSQSHLSAALREMRVSMELYKRKLLELLGQDHG